MVLTKGERRRMSALKEMKELGWLNPKGCKELNQLEKKAKKKVQEAKKKPKQVKKNELGFKDYWNVCKY